MDHKQEAKEILAAIKENRFIMRDHAETRSVERLVSRQNVINVAKTLIEWKWQDDHETYWFIGFLDQGQPGGFTAALDQGVWVVTVFKRKLTKREKGLIK